MPSNPAIVSARPRVRVDGSDRPALGEAAAALPWYPGQALLEDARPAADIAVVLHVVGQRQCDQHVLHLATHEAADEILFGRIEIAEVVRDRFTAGGIVDHDRVVAEALPEDFARLHGDHADARYRGVGFRAGCCAGNRVGSGLLRPDDAKTSTSPPKPARRIMISW